jgi:hypothetical protein
MRPEDRELEEGINYFRELFDYLGALPSYKFLEGEDTSALRRFSFEKHGGEGNMLFRPVGQVAIAQALGVLVFQKGLSIQEIFQKLNKFDEEQGFSHIELPQSIFYGVLYDPAKKRIQVYCKDLAPRLIIYILGGMNDKMEIAQLRQDLANARTIEKMSISFEGKYVEPKLVGLPPVL